MRRRQPSGPGIATDARRPSAGTPEPDHQGPPAPREPRASAMTMVRPLIAKRGRAPVQPARRPAIRIRVTPLPMSRPVFGRAHDLSGNIRRYALALRSHDGEPGGRRSIDLHASPTHRAPGTCGCTGDSAEKGWSADGVTGVYRQGSAGDVACLLRGEPQHRVADVARIERLDGQAVDEDAAQFGASADERLEGL